MLVLDSTNYTKMSREEEITESEHRTLIKLRSIFHIYMQDPENRTKSTISFYVIPNH